MTDNEIIKALECLEGEMILCKDCSYVNYAHFDCKRQAAKDALDLINRQKAEIENCYEFIEQLKKARNIWDDKCTHQNAEIERLQKLLDDKCDRCIAKDKVEAVKEFAERLKNEITIRTTHSKEQDKLVLFYIDNLVKEMVGENNG